MGAKLKGDSLTRNKNKDKTVYWECVLTSGLFPLKKVTWITRRGPPKHPNQSPQILTCGSCPDSNWILREFTFTTHNPAPWNSHLAHLTGVDLRIFQKWSFYIPRRGTKHSANDVTQILPGTCNEDIKLDRRFIGYLIFNCNLKKKKRKQRSQPTYIFGLRMNFFVLRDSFFLYLKICINTVKTGHAWWGICKILS